MQQAYVQGIRTHTADELVTALGATAISKSPVSRLCEEIDERVNAFFDRPLEGDWPYPSIDAAHVEVRRPGWIVLVATMIAAAVKSETRREELGMGLGPSEAEPFRTAFPGGMMQQ